MDRNVREALRQLLHVSGIVFLYPILRYEYIDALQILAFFVALTYFTDWYFTNRKVRLPHLKKVFKEAGLNKDQRKTLMDIFGKFTELEERFMNLFIRSLQRKAERPFEPMFKYFLGVFLTLALFGREIAALALIALAVGDSIATIIGKDFGKHKIFYSVNKTWEGFFAFLIAAFLAEYYFLSIFGFFEPLYYALFIAIGGALLESIPYANDNATIPVGIGLFLKLVGFI